MYTIQTLNKISDVIYEALPAETYQVSDAQSAPDAVLVRSAAMHELPVPPSLLAVARAGAGVNNTPSPSIPSAESAFLTPRAQTPTPWRSWSCWAMLMSGRKVVEGIEWALSLKGQPALPKLVEKGKGQFVGPELRGKTLGVIGLAPSARWWPTPRHRAWA